jgi:toxin YoeB
MKLLWSQSAWEDYLYWQQQSDQDILRRINQLVSDIQRQRFGGIGKPEPLRGDLAGWWSRRITGDHRIVYRIRGSGSEQLLEIVACRYHYSSRR